MDDVRNVFICSQNNLQDTFVAYKEKIQFNRKSAIKIHISKICIALNKYK